MFLLQNKEGEIALQKNGEPFQYSSRELAKIGKRVLDTERKDTFTIVKK